MGIFILYIVVMFFVSVYMSRKTETKLLGFAIIFWILTQPVLYAKFIISIPGLPFDLQPNRILLFFILSYLTYVKLMGVKTMQSKFAYVKRPTFEKYFFAYLFATILSLTYNFSNIPPKNLILEPSSILMFILLYYVAKDYMTKKLFDEVMKAIVLLSIVCALIAIIQIVVSNEFFKTGEARIAFGNIARATGIFREEYQLGHFQILAIFVVITTIKKSFFRQSLIALLVLSVLFTFHRLDILIMMTGYIIYNWVFGRASTRVIFSVSMVFVVLIGGSTFYILKPSIQNTDFAKERLSDTTIKGRFSQYEVILEAMPRYLLFGMGGYETKAYSDLMISTNHAYSVNGGTAKWYKVPYEVHNGYLAVGIYHGLIALSMFVTIMLLMLMYFKRRFSRIEPITFVPFIAVLIWIMSNLSNGLSSFSIYNTLLLSIIAGAFVSLFSGKEIVEAKAELVGVDSIKNKRILRKKISSFTS